MNKSKKISLSLQVSFLTINVLFLLFFIISLILMLTQSMVFSNFHLIMFFVILGINLLYLIYFAAVLIVNKVKSK